MVSRRGLILFPARMRRSIANATRPEEHLCEEAARPAQGADAA
jgi:hypothetical protein